MTLSMRFDNSFAALPEGFFARQQPRPASRPSLLAFNRPLAEALGIAAPQDADELAQVFAGNVLPDGADPLAMAYAGHQFGGFSPQLGDGRALLIGEVVDAAGRRWDLQLKGSGRTAFSRGGDGLAAIGPVLREYLVSEAMHAMGVPTSRALAAVATGDPVFRETQLPGAVLTRVASSHLRVGSFEFFAARGDKARLRQLMDFAIARHDPAADDPLSFLQGVIGRQAALVAQWMSLGFIHGVMNTDNCTISGETIDYGPCAFMDGYHPATVYSSIDRQGRYSYENQRHIIVWNMAQIASSVLALEDDPEAHIDTYTRVVHAMPDRIDTELRHRFGQKLGIEQARAEDQPMIDALLGLMQDQAVDFTNLFRRLGDEGPAGAAELFADPADFLQWARGWQARIAQEDAPQALMARVNPVIIPRNHRVETALTAALTGDMTPFEELRGALANPFDPALARSKLTLPPAPGEEIEATFCGT